MIAEISGHTYVPRMAGQNRSSDNDTKGERIAKVLARAGVGSRRDVERMIAEGRIALNGATVDNPATFIENTRGVTVNGRPIRQREGIRLWRYHKPRGLVTTHKDPDGRPTVFAALPGDMPRVISVGRLDFNTEGLLLLTNDGELARWMELPGTGWKRRYRVRVHGKVDDGTLEALGRGVTVEGVRYAPISAKLDRVQGSNAWLELGLREGKNREIRRVLEHFGLKVTRLIRTAYGPFELGSLPQGDVAEMSPETVRQSLPKEMADKLGLVPAPEQKGSAKKAARNKPPARKRIR